MGIDPSGYGVIDDYNYQTKQKSNVMQSFREAERKSLRPSNFYMDYYTSDNRGATPFPTAAELKGQWYKDYYTSGNSKATQIVNKNGEVIVKNPYPYGPQWVTKEVYNCMKDLENEDEFFDGNWFFDTDKLEAATYKLASEIEGIKTWELSNYQLQTLEAILNIIDGDINGEFDPRTHVELEQKLLVLGKSNRNEDVMNLSGDDIIDIYQSSNQKRSDFDKFLVYGGADVINGMMVMASYCTNSYAYQLGNEAMSWDQFRTASKGMGYTMDEMSAAYREYRLGYGIEVGSNTFTEPISVDFGADYTITDEYANYINESVLSQEKDSEY